MKAIPFPLIMAMGCVVTTCLAEDIITVDGQKYTDVRDVILKRNGLFFVTGKDNSMHGVTVPYDKLPEDIKEKYHCDPFELGMALARQNAVVYLNKHMVFSLDQLEEAKKLAAAQKKPLGFILEWDSMLIPSRPTGQGSNNGLAHFYDVFHEGLVLVFVRHENELDKIPEAVKHGMMGPLEGGWAPSMSVVTADCSQFICQVPFGGKDSSFAIREKIFGEKIAVIKKVLQTPAASK